MCFTVDTRSRWLLMACAILALLGLALHLVIDLSGHGSPLSGLRQIVCGMHNAVTLAEKVAHDLPIALEFRAWQDPMHWISLYLPPPLLPPIL